MTRPDPTCPACRGRGVVLTLDHGGERERETCDCVRPRAVRRTVVFSGEHHDQPARIGSPSPDPYVAREIVRLVDPPGRHGALVRALLAGDTEDAARLAGRPLRRAS